MIEKYLVKKITEPVDWKVTVPGSKSMTNRALLLAALSAGTVRVEGVLFSDDSRHFLACLVSLGFAVQIEEEKKCVTVTGCGGRIPSREAVIDAPGQRRVSLRRCSDFQTGVMRSAVQRR